METRLATVGDAPLLAALHAESFGAAGWSAADIATSLALATTRGVIAVADQPCGFILFQIVDDEFEILTLCVAPALRDRGIGRYLLETVLTEAQQKDTRKVFLEVADDNHAALRLYQKTGFRIIGRRVNYYRRGDQFIDAILLCL